MKQFSVDTIYSLDSWALSQLYWITMLPICTHEQERNFLFSILWNPQLTFRSLSFTWLGYEYYVTIFRFVLFHRRFCCAIDISFVLSLCEINWNLINHIFPNSNYNRVIGWLLALSEYCTVIKISILAQRHQSGLEFVSMDTAIFGFQEHQNTTLFIVTLLRQLSDWAMPALA